MLLTYYLLLVGVNAVNVVNAVISVYDQRGFLRHPILEAVREDGRSYIYWLCGLNTFSLMQGRIRGRLFTQYFCINTVPPMLLTKYPTTVATIET